MNNKIFISHADTPLGDMVAQELLVGKNKDRFEEIICSVHKIEYSGNLWALGGCVVEHTDHEEELKRQLKGVETLVLVPNIARSSMVNHARSLVGAAKQANVKTCILTSILGAEENTQTSKMFREIEELVRQADFDNCLVTRNGMFQQTLFFFTKAIRMESRLPMPWQKSEQAKTAPVNIHDVSRFVGHLCAEGQRMKKHAQLYKLTGPELFTGEQLVENLNKSIGGQNQIRFEEVSEKDTERYLRETLGLHEMVVRFHLDEWRLVNNGKLNFISNDEKKSSGIEPIRFGEFAKEYQHRFGRGGERRL